MQFGATDLHDALGDYVRTGSHPEVEEAKERNFGPRESFVLAILFALVIAIVALAFAPIA